MKTDAKEAEVERFYEDVQDLIELMPKKDMSFSSERTGMHKKEVKRNLQ